MVANGFRCGSKVGITFNAVSSGAIAAVTSGIAPMYPLNTFAKISSLFSCEAFAVAISTVAFHSLSPG
jgi:hypothetical protein